MNDLISREAAIADGKSLDELDTPIGTLVNLQPEQQWIPFTTRPCTEQEKEEHPDWEFYIDCQLPDDGDSILISTNSGYVREDKIFCEYDCWYLDSGYVIGEEAVAWMPLPDPYKGDEQ